MGMANEPRRSRQPRPAPRRTTAARPGEYWTRIEELAPDIVEEVDRCVALAMERERRRQLHGMTVGEWRTRRRIGTWTLFVEGHVLVVRAGEIIAGEREGEDDEQIEQAWRVLPRVDS
ncbi:MAG: hypothetical protein U5O39_03400 [Gammaproteobacteria bacterium]|nr:hypothetical protein [Gammaproteobacteria bacterium]